jgi:glycosyltransferase involved in cell wall biosynthesis
MTKLKGSVIIPVYNQYEPLCKVLRGFKWQDTYTNEYEIIIVDDGSDDFLAQESSLSLQKQYALNIEIIHQENSGRAAARNAGISHCQSDYIIFCDGDRIPHIKFISEHLSYSAGFNNVVVGNSYDYFGNHNKLHENKFDWAYILKFSRLPVFYQKINNLYKEQQQSKGKYIWLSFLAGNSSINKDLLKNAGCFDESIKEWGFEHFELGYRLYKYGANFKINNEAKSFHIPHKREKDFYNTQLSKSIDLIYSKHSELDVSFLKDFFGVSEGLS